MWYNRLYHCIYYDDLSSSFHSIYYTYTSTRNLCTLLIFITSEQHNCRLIINQIIFYVQSDISHKRYSLTKIVFPRVDLFRARVSPHPSSIKIPLKFYKKISFQKFSHLYLCYELARNVARVVVYMNCESQI